LLSVGYVLLRLVALVIAAVINHYVFTIS